MLRHMLPGLRSHSSSSLFTSLSWAHIAPTLDGTEHRKVGDAVPVDPRTPGLSRYRTLLDRVSHVQWLFKNHRALLCFQTRLCSVSYEPRPVHLDDARDHPSPPSDTVELSPCVATLTLQTPLGHQLVTRDTGRTGEFCARARAYSLRRSATRSINLL